MTTFAGQFLSLNTRIEIIDLSIIIVCNLRLLSMRLATVNRHRIQRIYSVFLAAQALNDFWTVITAKQIRCCTIDIAFCLYDIFSRCLILFMPLTDTVPPSSIYVEGRINGSVIILAADSQAALSLTCWSRGSKPAASVTWSLRSGVSLAATTGNTSSTSPGLFDIWSAVTIQVRWLTGPDVVTCRVNCAALSAPGDVMIGILTTCSYNILHIHWLPPCSSNREYNTVQQDTIQYNTVQVDCFVTVHHKLHKDASPNDIREHCSSTDDRLFVIRHRRSSSLCEIV